VAEATLVNERQRLILVMYSEPLLTQNLRCGKIY